MRTLKSKDEQHEASPSLIASSPVQVPSKRRCISNACMPCRKRKSKCDGGKPRCSTCTAVYQTECFYDLDSDYRRKAALKRDIETLREQNGTLGIILASLRTSTDAEALEILQQIRADEDLDHLAETLKGHVFLNEHPNASGAEGELANLIGRPSIDSDGVLRHWGSTASLGLVSGPRIQPPIPRHTTDVWTTVTSDSAFIQHLLDLYFCWSHPVYTLFSKDLFMHDMANGGSKYCSSLLVNGILALGCTYSDRPEARTNPSDPKTAGERFYIEARRLLENSESCLTTVQALAIIGLYEVAFDNDSRGYQYAGRCIRMAIELGLHLSFGKDSSRFGSTELGARKITFWGCFTIDTAWSICVGRISQLPSAAINIEMPSINEEDESKPWQLVTDQGPTSAGEPSLIYTILTQHAHLSQIVNDTNFLFYAPRERFTSRKLLDLHKRYTKWFERLPENVELKEYSSPQLYTLHLYYHTVVSHLFRPFLRVDLTNSKLSPREVCTSCAGTVSLLLSNFRRIYGFRRCSLILTHIILSANIIHLINLPDPSAAGHLVNGVRALREMSICHPYALRPLNVILLLAKQWNKQLPPEVIQAANASKQESVCQSDSSLTGSLHQASSTPLLSHSPASTEIDHQSYETTSSSIKGSPKPPSSTADIFWSPFPDQTVPLQGLQPAGPMDIYSILDSQGSNEWMQLNRDGFKMADMNDPTLGPPGFSPTADWP